MKLIHIMLFTLLVTAISACDSDKKNKDKTIKTQARPAVSTPVAKQKSILANTAKITISEKSYTLPIRLCNKPRTDTFKGQSITHYSILAQNSPIGAKKIIFPIFSISGVTGDKGNIANYKLELNSNGLKKTYSGKAPYEIFDSGKIHYKGKTKEGKKIVPIEIRVNCA